MNILKKEVMSISSRLGKAVILLLVFVGCTNDYDSQTELVDEQMQEEAETEMPYGLIDEVAVFIVGDIFEEDGNVMASLIPSEPMLVFLENPRFIGLAEGPDKIVRIWASDFDNSILWLEGRNSVKIENENNATITDATTLDIVEGDVLRLYIREVGSPFDEWGGSMVRNSLERIVIVR